MAAGILTFSFLANKHPAKQARSFQGMDLIAREKPFLPMISKDQVEQGEGSDQLTSVVGDDDFPVWSLGEL